MKYFYRIESKIFCYSKKQFSNKNKTFDQHLDIVTFGVAEVAVVVWKKLFFRKKKVLHIVT